MNWKEPKLYAVQHKDECVRSQSRSGGAFTALTDYILENNGVIYGCILSDELEVVHVRTDNCEGRNQMRGSKYVQSKLGDTLRNVKNDLKAGREVLFSGTSCQVAGLKSFLGQEYENLLCVDIVCHGVPSPLVWKKYLEWQEKRNYSKIIKVDFRNKKDFGWRAHKETTWFSNGIKRNSSIFTTLFYGHSILRPSCYKCHYKSIMHPGDITLADYWGIEKAAPEFDDNKGCSLVLINNEKGEQIFQRIANNIRWKATQIQDSMQRPFESPYEQPEERNQFWDDFHTKSFGYITKKYADAGLIKRGIRKIKRKLVNK